MAFYEDDIDIREYVNKRILQIESLEDRILYKDMAENFMTTLFKLQRDEKNNLTKKVISEFSLSDSRYEIAIGISQRSKIDGTDTYLYPMIDSDKSENITDEINSSLDKNQPYFIENIFLKDTYINTNNFARIGEFKGIIRTANNTYDAHFQVVNDTRYMDKISELAGAFGNNGINWNTVILAYLVRTFAVYVTNIDEKSLEGEFIGYEIDFGQFNNKVVKDIVPLWNISSFSEKTSSFPSSVNDKLAYKHQIIYDDKNKGNKVIVANLDTYIYTISMEDSRHISIVTNDSQPRTWKFYKFHNNLRNDNYEFPPLSNEVDTNLSLGLRVKYKNVIGTKAEICRICEETPFRDKLKLTSIEIVPNYSNQSMVYDMNAIINNEYLEDKRVFESGKKVLLLKFKTNFTDDYLIQDYMSFITTNVSEYLKQYKVVAEIEV